MALELLGMDACEACADVLGADLGPEDETAQAGDIFCCHDLELVAARAREEMREAAALAAIDAAVDGFYDESADKVTKRILDAIRAIRALPVKP
jgi:hypothetical protein